MPGVDFKLAVCGVRARSEHEDDCVVTVDLISDAARGAKESVRAALEHDARARLSKTSVPDAVRWAKIPRNFKGAVLLGELRSAVEREYN